METKPGHLTTEFWVSVIGGIYMALNATGILEQVPNKWAAIVLAIITAAYNVSRGLAKTGTKPDPGLYQ